MVGGGAGRNEIGGTSPTYQFCNDGVPTSGIVDLADGWADCLFERPSARAGVCSARAAW